MTDTEGTYIIMTHIKGLKNTEGVNYKFMEGSNIRFNIKTVIRGYTGVGLYIATQKTNIDKM